MQNGLTLEHRVEFLLRSTIVFLLFLLVICFKVKSIGSRYIASEMVALFFVETIFLDSTATKYG